MFHGRLDTPDDTVVGIKEKKILINTIINSSQLDATT